MDAEQISGIFSQVGLVQVPETDLALRKFPSDFLFPKKTETERTSFPRPASESEIPYDVPLMDGDPDGTSSHAELIDIRIGNNVDGALIHHHNGRVAGCGPVKLTDSKTIVVGGVQDPVYRRFGIRGFVDNHPHNNTSMLQQILSAGEETKPTITITFTKTTSSTTCRSRTTVGKRS